MARIARTPRCDQALVMWVGLELGLAPELAHGPAQAIWLGQEPALAPAQARGLALAPAEGQMPATYPISWACKAPVEEARDHSVPHHGQAKAISPALAAPAKAAVARCVPVTID